MTADEAHVTATKRAFDLAIERTTTATCEALDVVALKFDIPRHQMLALIRERAGDLEDIYAEWIDEAWDIA